MIKRIPRSAVYRVRAAENFYPAMRDDIRLLWNHKAYTTCTTVVLCCIDALASGDGHATRSKFQDFVTRYFPDLCVDFERLIPGQSGAATLYNRFRNGFAHLRGPKSGFAIAEDHEVEGHYAEEVAVEGLGKVVALNVDRLFRDFLLLLDRLEQEYGLTGG